MMWSNITINDFEIVVLQLGRLRSMLNGGNVNNNILYDVKVRQLIVLF